MTTYEHKVQFYESDGMGITHHSNYIRWFEEARIALLEEIGFPYEAIVAHGMHSPVLTVSSAYKSPTRFGDIAVVAAKTTGYNGVKMTLSYEIRNKATGALCCTGESSHCFTDLTGRPVRLSRAWPELDAAIAALAAQD